MARISLLGALAVCGILGCPGARAQDRLALMPKYDSYVAAEKEISGLNRSLQVQIPAGFTWSEDGQKVTYRVGAKWFAYDVKLGKVVDAAAPSAGGPTGRNRGQAARGRQYSTVFSADEQWVARHVAGNVEIEEVKTKTKTAVTQEGGKNRIKFGTGSWVYGEELDQREAMWWSPDATKLAFYRFDESKVPDYYLTTGQGEVQNDLYTEAYPKAGAPNPVVDLLIYDRLTKKTTKIDVRFSSGSDPDLGHYVYAVRWLPGKSGLLYFRMNRLQQVLEVVKYDPATGKQSVVVKEENPKGWVDYRPGNVWTDSGNELEMAGSSFIWLSERTGFRNLYLVKLDGSIKPLTNFNFDVHSIEKVDVKRGRVWFMARSASNPLWTQLHRVNFDGSNLVAVATAPGSHVVNISPDGTTLIDTSASIEQPTSVRVLDENGKTLADLGKGDPDHYVKAGFKATERFSCTAADGKTQIGGYLRFPKNFDPTKKYPLLVDVYGGPESGTNRERFIGPDARCEFGFIVAWIDGRGTNGRGRDFRQSVYKKLGTVEIDDQAAAVKFLATKPYIDGTKVGINGTSYGGYASLMALLRHPDVFHAAAASSSVTSWVNYDSIYTERYMSTPQLNPGGYKDGSAMEYAKNLKGRLLLFYGTADDNVHPSNTHQLIRALDRAGKSYELAVGVDQGHAGVNGRRELEFFIDALILGNTGGRKL